MLGKTWLAGCWGWAAPSAGEPPHAPMLQPSALAMTRPPYMPPLWGLYAVYRVPYTTYRGLAPTAVFLRPAGATRSQRCSTGRPSGTVDNRRGCQPPPDQHEMPSALAMTAVQNNPSAPASLRTQRSLSLSECLRFGIFALPLQRVWCRYMP